jgi:hypothetical protein
MNPHRETRNPCTRGGQGADRIRTGVRGFAGLCLTTRPPRRHEIIVSSELFDLTGVERIRQICTE